MIYRTHRQKLISTAAAERSSAAHHIAVTSRHSLRRVLDAARRAKAAAENLATQMRPENSLGDHNGIGALIGELKKMPVARVAELDLWSLPVPRTPDLRALPPAEQRPLQLYDVVEVTEEGSSLPKGARGIVVNLHMKAARDPAGAWMRDAEGAVVRVPALAEVMVLSPRKMGEVEASSLQILRLSRP